MQIKFVEKRIGMNKTFREDFFLYFIKFIARRRKTYRKENLENEKDQEKIVENMKWKNSLTLAYGVAQDANGILSVCCINKK